MNRLYSLICVLILSIACLSAQNVITGTVTDSEGNPVPGAKVTVVNGTESAITELDGTFRIETKFPAKEIMVYYVGMQTVKMAVKKDMTVKLTKTNWWNKIPDSYSWFVSLQGVFPESGMKKPAFGVMAGRVKNIGWYLKGVYNGNAATDGTYKEQYWTTGEYKKSYYAFTGGVIVRLNCALHAYGGVGYSDRSVGWQVANGEYLKHPEYDYSGFTIDYGLMLRLNRIVVNAGLVSCACDGLKFAGNIGVGVSF